MSAAFTKCAALAVAALLLVVTVDAGLLMADAGGPVTADFKAPEQARISALTAIFQQASPAVVRVFNRQQYASGTIVTPDGLIVTHFDIAKRDELEVLTTDGRRLKARLLLRDAPTQLAILRLIPAADSAAPPAAEPVENDTIAAPDGDANQLAPTPDATAAGAMGGPAVDWPYIPLGRSEGAAVGAWVATVAYPVGSDMKRFTEPAFSAGLLAGRGKFDSGLKHDGELLLTDATANAGSQGGALIDAQGRLIGILTLPIYYRPTNSALNVALPAEAVAPLLIRAVESPDAPLQAAPVAGAPGAFLGVVRAEQASNCRISGVLPGSPAEKAGLRPDDVISAINGHEVANFEALAATMAKAKPGDVIVVTVQRPTAAGSETIELSATLGARE